MEHDESNDNFCQDDQDLNEESRSAKRIRKRPRTVKNEVVQESANTERAQWAPPVLTSPKDKEPKQDPKSDIRSYPPVQLHSSQLQPPNLNFTRDELLVMSSEDFESNVSRLSALRPLTTSEKNLIKRQRRLIKNIESAQASRQRKKDYVDDLESKVESLVLNNARLKEDFASLLTENSSLKNEVEFLSQLVRRIKVY